MPDVTSSQAAGAAADPVAMISALLDAEKVIPDKTSEKPAGLKPEGEAQPEGDADYQPGENANVEGEDAPAGDGEKPPVAEIPLDQLEAIELETTYKTDDGKDVTEKLTIKELRQGYMRQKDYGRKTTEVARQREELGNSVRQGIESERSQYLNTLQQLKTQLIETVAPELKNVDWNNLATNDAFEYVRLQNRANQINQALQNIDAKQQETKTKIEADQHQAVKAAVQKAVATLASDIPGWNDALYQKLMQSGESVGYKQEEVSKWVDARAIKLLHKAYLYDQLKAGKPSADKKVVVPPVAIKPGATAAVSKQTQQQGKALERLRKSGKLDDLTAVIASM